MTNPHARERQYPRPHRTSHKFVGGPSDVENTELGPDHYSEPAVRKLQKSIAHRNSSGVALDSALGSESGKWPIGLVTAGVITMSCFLWLLIFATIRQFY